MEEVFFFHLHLSYYRIYGHPKHETRAAITRAPSPAAERFPHMMERVLPHLLLHSNSLTHFTFISGKNQEVLVFSSWRGAHYNVHIIHLSLQPHIQHQLHALRAHNHTEARTLQWHCIGFATDFIVAGLHIVLGKGVIINQNLF